MGSNRGVVYLEPGKVEVQDIDEAKPELNYKGKTRQCQHGVILKVVSTNICGSDQHMVRGRTTAPAGYEGFDKGAAGKFVIDPHGMVAA